VEIDYLVADLSLPGSLWLLAPGVVLKNYFCSLEPGLRVGRGDNDFTNANCFYLRGLKVEGGECWNSRTGQALFERNCFPVFWIGRVNTILLFAKS
jgi:hypothetical protein